MEAWVPSGSHGAKPQWTTGCRVGVTLEGGVVSGQRVSPNHTALLTLYLREMQGFLCPPE